MKILIAEDDQLLQILHSELMKGWGYGFDMASNGKEAVEYAQKNEGKYDLCLMDIDMPIMDGLEATKIIRRKTKYFPIMALTGRSEHRKECLKIGMDDFLEKPCFPDVLYDKISDLTVKAVKIQKGQNKIKWEKEMPVNSEQLKELIQLDKKGLALLIIDKGEHRFVVHKNIQNKMSHVLIGEGKCLFEFLDRGDTPANCHLYKCNLQTNRLLLTQEEFEKRLKAENHDIDKYTSTVDKTFPAENENKREDE